MDLDRSLLKEFAKITNDSEAKAENKYLRGTIVSNSSGKYVQMDGSSTITPISELIEVEEGDRVLVSIENHKATIVGNFTFPPSARKEQEALDKANTAQGTANGANETANAAQQKAQEASEKADEAFEQSSIASASADEAKQQATEAISKANEAQENIQETKDLATEANTMSTEAKQLAASSQAASADAQAEVTRLQGEVDTAKENIDKALEDLEAQAEDLTIVKNTYSTKVETENAKAELSTEIDTKVGSLQVTMEKDYSTKTENVELEGRLQSQITVNAEGLAIHNEKIEKVEADTAEAQKDVATALADASAARTAANTAQTKADEAKDAADQATADAQAADEKATLARNAADQAIAAANAADQAVQEAQGDLNEAKQNLASVTSRVDATEADIADAQAKVDAAQLAVNEALADAAEANNAANIAQEAAEKAQQDAETAQGVATSAQQKAENAQTAANQATEKAEKAQEDVAALTSRVTKAETDIVKTNEQVTITAGKTEEIGTKLATDYYSKTDTDALIQVEAGRITDLVTNIETVERDLSGLTIGGRNLLPDTDFDNESKLRTEPEGGTGEGGFHFTPVEQIESGVEYTLSARIRGTSDVVFYQINEGGNVSRHWIKKEDLSETEYRKFDITFIVEEDRTFIDVYICTKYGTTAAGEWFEIEPRSLKLEKGNKATDWSPAPEDYTNELQTVKDDAKEIESRANAAFTLSQTLAGSIENILVDDNGIAYMESTEDGWKLNLSKITGDLKSVADDILAAQADGEVTKDEIEELKKLLAGISEKTAYFDIGQDSSGNPYFILGRHDQDFKVHITHTAINFMDGQYELASANNKMFVVNIVRAKQEFQIVNETLKTGFAWKVRENGNMGLVPIVM